MAQRLPICQSCGEHDMSNFKVVEHRYYRRLISKGRQRGFSEPIACDSSLIECICGHTWRSAASYVHNLARGDYAKT